MNNLRYISEIKQFKKLSLTRFFGKPIIYSLGAKLKNLIIRNILTQTGSSVYIKNTVEFLGSTYIEIWNASYSLLGLVINGRCYDNNHISLESGVIIERNVGIFSLDNTYIEIGQYTFIGPNVCIAGPGNIRIGKHCLIAAQVGIYANNYKFKYLIKLIQKQSINYKGIVIEDDCCLGYGVKVLDGVTIGKGSIISAGVVVTQNIPPYSRINVSKLT